MTIRIGVACGILQGIADVIYWPLKQSFECKINTPETGRKAEAEVVRRVMPDSRKTSMTEDELFRVAVIPDGTAGRNA